LRLIPIVAPQPQRASVRFLAFHSVKGTPDFKFDSLIDIGRDLLILMPT
jgi:hypothetical protein